jgi:hypothetical protein
VEQPPGNFAYPQPTSYDPYHQPDPASGPPATPWSAPPAPTTDPASGPPATPWSAPPAPTTDPASGPPATPWSAPPAPTTGPAFPPPTGPSPRPPARAGRALLWALVGLLAGLALFGPTGYLVGTKMTLKAGPTTPPSSSDTPAALPPYERNQLVLNSDKFSGDLRKFAGSWLPYVFNCVKNGDKNGPTLGDGEVSRVTCLYDTTSVRFIKYASNADRDRARERRYQDYRNSIALVPGMVEPGPKKNSSGNANGVYVEYGFKFDDGRTFAGLWWDDNDTPVAGILIAEWNGGPAGNWEPIRDLWQRHS